MEALCGEMFFSSEGICKRCCENSQWVPSEIPYKTGMRSSLARPRGSTNQALRCAEKRQHNKILVGGDG